MIRSLAEVFKSFFSLFNLVSQMKVGDPLIWVAQESATTCKKILMLDPEGTKTEGDRTKVLIERQLKKDGIMIRGAVRKDFGRG